MATRKRGTGPLVYCPRCGKPLQDTTRNVHEGCPEDPRLWVSVPPPS
jgi:hypothetical protein